MTYVHLYTYSQYKGHLEGPYPYIYTYTQYIHNVSVLHQNEGGIGKFNPESQEISRDPRDSPVSREISRAEGMDFSFSHHWQGSIDFNTVRTTRPTGMYFLIHP